MCVPGNTHAKAKGTFVEAVKLSDIKGEPMLLTGHDHHHMSHSSHSINAIHSINASFWTGI
jgi:dTDP-4-dehydrorhamnose 3,5-epimerase-like enzyme